MWNFLNFPDREVLLGGCLSSKQICRECKISLLSGAGLKRSLTVKPCRPGLYLIAFIFTSFYFRCIFFHGENKIFNWNPKPMNVLIRGCGKRENLGTGFSVWCAEVHVCVEWQRISHRNREKNGNFHASLHSPHNFPFFAVSTFAINLQKLALHKFSSSFAAASEWKRFFANIRQNVLLIN